MALPKTPFPGMVVRYSFLWSSEARAGETEGRKDRPCVIITAVMRMPDARFRVRVLPITHRPAEPARSVAIPARVKRHLGLDADASWIVLDEVNEFVWPGVDLRPVSPAKPGVWTFGILPSETFEEIRAKLRMVIQQRVSSGNIAAGSARSSTSGATREQADLRVRRYGGRNAAE